MHFSDLKMAIRSRSFLARSPPSFSSNVRPSVRCELPIFVSKKPKKKEHFFYDLSFILCTDANEPLYNRIYIRQNRNDICGRMGRKDFRPLAFESLLVLTRGKKCPARCVAVRCFVVCALRRSRCCFIL